MQTADFNYFLPTERIAQTPVSPRDHSRLMVLDRATQTIKHHHFFELDHFLRPGDLLIMNESKVFKARLFASLGTQGQDYSIEIFLLRPEGEYWIALAKPGRKLHPNSIITFSDSSTAQVIEKRADGTVLIDFHKPTEDVFAWADHIGNIPTPPYVELSIDDENAYQTIYAKTIGSVAAPTAGLHFTSELLESLQIKGIRTATVTLHVGLGTFRPMKTNTLEEHQMHEEWVDIPSETFRAIEKTRAQGGRVIAVGTTTVRALESGLQYGLTRVFITPGYRFKYVDAMITNFHLPKSTLLVLVSAFANRDFILRAYHDAIKKDYRFYSFGDAMLVI